MDIFLVVLAGLMVLVGIAGSVLPVLPGLPVSWAGLLLLKFTERAGDEISWQSIIWTGVIVVVVTILDSVLPVWGTKRRGGGKKVVIGASVGLLLGFFLGIPGLIFGPFVGALVGALMEGHRLGQSTHLAFGAFIGFVAGIVLKLVCGGVIAWIFVAALF